MSNKNLWFGYLEAGEKSSPVVMDRRLDTANTNTAYLYNHKRGEIIEYRRDIIDAKLRPLNGQDGASEKDLQSAFKQVRKNFTPRGGKVGAIPDKVVQKPAPQKEQPIEEESEEEIGDLVIEGVDEEWDEG